MGLPDPAANIFVDKGIDSGQQLLVRLQRLRGLLEQQRRLAAAAARGSGGSGGTSGSGSGASARNSGSTACARPVRLLVVDSVAHVMRDMGDTVGVGELAGRTELLFKISALLRWGGQAGLCWEGRKVCACADIKSRGGSWPAGQEGWQPG